MGIDPTTKRLDGKPSSIWITTDEREEFNSEKAFPQWAYLKMMFGLFQREPVVGIQKSRQVFATTGTLGYAFHWAAFRKRQKVQLSKATREEAEILLEEKIRVPFTRMPPWIRDALEITDKPAGRISFRSTTTPRHESTRSVIEAVGQNAAVRSLRGGTASLVIIDEAALQDNLSAMLRAAAPMAARIICLTSADGGEAGGEAFVNYFECLPDKQKHLKPISLPFDDVKDLPEDWVHAEPAREIVSFEGLPEGL